MHAADLAEKMSDFLGVEAILCQHVFSGEECEVGRWHEGQNKALLLAVRTVARHRLREICFYFVPHCPAMTSTGIFLHSIFQDWITLATLFYHPSEMTAISLGRSFPLFKPKVGNNADTGAMVAQFAQSDVVNKKGEFALWEMSQDINDRLV